MSLMSRLQAQQQVDKSVDAVQVNREITGAKFQEPVYFIHREVIKELGGELQVGGRDEEQTHPGQHRLGGQIAGQSARPALDHRGDVAPPPRQHYRGHLPDAPG
jgi:hypothetical protein